MGRRDEEGGSRYEHLNELNESAMESSPWHEHLYQQGIDESDVAQNEGLQSNIGRIINTVFAALEFAFDDEDEDDEYDEGYDQGYAQSLEDAEYSDEEISRRWRELRGLE